MKLDIVILAAGLSKRMHSQAPKALHCLAGKPLLEHLVETALELLAGQTPIVVCGDKGELLQQALSTFKLTWISQNLPLGTGDALLQALPYLKAKQVLVLYGDVPLVSAATLKEFIASKAANSLGLLTANFPDPRGLGRILRDENNQMVGIVEEKDANEVQRKIKEINAGIYLIPCEYLNKWLPQLKNTNKQQEFYLTDIIEMAIQDGIPIQGFRAKQWKEVLGADNQTQLAKLERYYQKNYAKKLMRQGVTLQDPARIDVRGELKVGKDVIIDINVIFEGKVEIGNNCVIGPNTILRNTVLGDNVEIKANSYIDGAQIAENCVIGPYARVRPGTILAPHIHLGNFVEVKNSSIGAGSKINHLSYIGDSTIGKEVNIGAGTITCNYDGVNKYPTIIEDNVFIGSNTQLIAPVTIGKGATIGAGSTITEDAPPNKLTLARTQQSTVAHWKKPKKRIKPNEK